MQAQTAARVRNSGDGSSHATMGGDADCASVGSMARREHPHSCKSELLAQENGLVTVTVDIQDGSRQRGERQASPSPGK